MVGGLMNLPRILDGNRRVGASSASWAEEISAVNIE
jgi:hypothetical protein